MLANKKIVAIGNQMAGMEPVSILNQVGQYIGKVRLAQCLLNGQWLQYQYVNTSWPIQQWLHPNQIGQLSTHLWSDVTLGWPINHCPHPNQVGQWGTHVWFHTTLVGQWGIYLWSHTTLVGQ